MASASSSTVSSLTSGFSNLSMGRSSEFFKTAVEPSAIELEALDKLIPKTTLPYDRNFRNEKRAAVKFFDTNDKIDYRNWPKTASIDPDVKRYFSYLIDESTRKAYIKAVALFRISKEYKAGLSEINGSKKNCGGFKGTTKILTAFSPFEQMILLKDYIEAHANNWTKGRRTLCFGVRNSFDVVPLYVQSTSNSKASLMKTTIGCGSKGKLKVPTYDDLSKDPALSQGNALLPALEALETVRQPHFSGATTIKGNALAAGTIGARRRYEIWDIKSTSENAQKSQFACVELTDQNKPDAQPFKQRSAASNLFSLVKKSPTKLMAPKLQYEKVAPKGYKDDSDIDIKSKELWSALKKTVKQSDSSDLDKLMEKLFYQRVGSFTSENINNFFSAKFFGKDRNNIEIDTGNIDERVASLLPAKKQPLPQKKC